jgi:hypothetical protein
LLAQPLVAPSLQRLFSKGVVEQDIVELANLFENSNGTDGGGSGGSTDTNGLQKYGKIKYTIQQLDQQADKLRNQIDELQRQKQGLDEKNQKMLSVLAYSDPVVKFLRGSDHSFSNDNDNVKILTMIALILYILYFRYVGVEKLLDDDLNKLFVRLSSAVAAGGEEAVSIPELKTAVEKALRVLIAKLDTKSQDNEDIFLANKK